MSFIPGMFPSGIGEEVPGAPGPGETQVAFLFRSVQRNLRVPVWENVPIGAPSADRLIVVGVNGEIRSGDRPLCWVNNPLANLEVEIQSEPITTGSCLYAALFSALVTTGTVADIQIGWAMGAMITGIGVWRVTGTDQTAYDTATSPYNPGTATLTTSYPAVGIAHSHAWGGTNMLGPTCSWDSPSGNPLWLTESFESDHGYGHAHSGACSFNPWPSGNHDLQDTWSNLTADGKVVSVFATWQLQP